MLVTLRREVASLCPLCPQRRWCPGHGAVGMGPLHDDQGWAALLPLRQLRRGAAGRGGRAWRALTLSPARARPRDDRVCAVDARTAALPQQCTGQRAWAGRQERDLARDAQAGQRRPAETAVPPTWPLASPTWCRALCASGVRAVPPRGGAVDGPRILLCHGRGHTTQARSCGRGATS